MPTDEELAVYKEAFDCFDKDKDGKERGYISPQDFASCIRMLGANPSEKEVAEFQKEIGKDKITFNALVKIMPKVQARERDTIDDIMECFQMFDKDGNGFITFGELKHIYCGMGERFTDAEFEEMKKSLDDGSGTIAYEEFAKMMLAES